jgi:hypothetical protein
MHVGTNILSSAPFASNTRRTQPGAFQPGLLTRTSLKLRKGPAAGFITCFSDFSLWFSLPLSIWLSTGWIGLIFHWQAIAGRACQAEVATNQTISTQQQHSN